MKFKINQKKKKTHPFSQWRPWLPWSSLPTMTSTPLNSNLILLFSALTLSLTMTLPLTRLRPSRLTHHSNSQVLRPRHWVRQPQHPSPQPSLKQHHNWSFWHWCVARIEKLQQFRFNQDFHLVVRPVWVWTQFQTHSVAKKLIAAWSFSKGYRMASGGGEGENRMRERVSSSEILDFIF